MSRDSTVIRFRQPEAIDDPLSELAREGARRMLAQVLIAEADSFVAMWKDLKLPDGRNPVVRHGHGPHRAIQTGGAGSKHCLHPTSPFLMRSHRLAGILGSLSDVRRDPSGLVAD
jgi:hypothetical protein